jgi:hypothetical protein
MATVVLVEPGHRQFQRAPGVEAGCPRIGVRHSFRLDGRLREQGPLRKVEEGEVAHGRLGAEATQKVGYSRALPLYVQNEVGLTHKCGEKNLSELRVEGWVHSTLLDFPY